MYQIRQIPQKSNSSSWSTAKSSYSLAAALGRLSNVGEAEVSKSIGVHLFVPSGKFGETLIRKSNIRCLPGLPVSAIIAVADDREEDLRTDISASNMGRVLQKRKNRSGAPKNKIKSNRTKSGKKKINVLGNAIIAKNWDKKLTLTQNYRRLGLATRLSAPTGGIDKTPSTTKSPRSAAQSVTPLAITETRGTKLQPSEVQVERDPKTGRILRIIRPDEGRDEETIEIAGHKRRKVNPLNDPLNELSDVENFVPEATGVSTDVISALEKQAAAEEEQLKKRRPRHQSKREEEWLQRLVEKYGDDVPAMVRDRKLNPMQQSEGNIRKRLRKWKENRK
ncbi:Nucleolar protein 16 [Emydomyces testavorans]|uniref:Nucleolar protein 16 n=1 Tax=Emydomyces testavorans TaxID=2070801 RepID=A0AAF0DEX5_9EURO|nr:Nucleolar protein 16 [Emydomyces testavorans]